MESRAMSRKARGVGQPRLGTFQENRREDGAIGPQQSLGVFQQLLGGQQKFESVREARRPGRLAVGAALVHDDS
jgi:hypothetical protein